MLHKAYIARRYETRSDRINNEQRCFIRHWRLAVETRPYAVQPCCGRNLVMNTYAHVKWYLLICRYVTSGGLWNAGLRAVCSWTLRPARVTSPNSISDYPHHHIIAILKFVQLWKPINSRPLLSLTSSWFRNTLFNDLLPRTKVIGAFFRN